MHSYVHRSIICNSQTWKQPKCLSINEQMKCCLYATEDDSAIKKKKRKEKKKGRNLATCTNMGGPRGHCAEGSQSAEKDKFQNFTCPWNLKKQTHEQTRNRLIDTEIMLMVARWEGGWGLGEKGGGIQYKSEVTQ